MAMMNKRAKTNFVFGMTNNVSKYKNSNNI